MNTTAKISAAKHAPSPQVPRQELHCKSGRCCRRDINTSRGFSLVEVLVAMVIGLIGLVVMMQVFSVFEGQKRTTSSGDDAISGGSMALYAIQRDIQQSGWGINAVQLLDCTANDAGNLLLQGVTSIRLAPVTINPAVATLPAGESDTDTLLVVSGNSNSTIEGDLITSGVAAGGSTYSVHTPLAFAAGDYVIAVRQDRTDRAEATVPVACAVQINKVASVDAGAGTVQLVSGATDASSVGDRLFNLGAAPIVRGYAIRKIPATNGVEKLTVCSYTDPTLDCTDEGSWLPIANNIVSLRAQYRRVGTNTTLTGAPYAPADTWDQNFVTSGVTTATNIGFGGAPVACAQMRLRGVRLALVARSSQPERPAKDATNNDVHVWQSGINWAGSVTNVADGNSAAAAGAVQIVPQSPNTTFPRWDDFRYKLFETVAPLRNITMRGVPEEC